jgi:hypothetical protein
VLYYPNFEPNLPWLKAILLLTDEVVRLIPKEANHVDSDGILRLKELFPDSVSEFSPTREDIHFGDSDLRRLDTAFSLLEGTTDTANKRIRMHHGRIEIEGHEFLHNRKVSDAVRALLINHRLLDQTARQVVDIDEDWLVVEKSASDLIVSQVADKIARSHGLDTTAFVSPPIAAALAGVSVVVQAIEKLSTAIYDGEVKLQKYRLLFRKKSYEHGGSHELVADSSPRLLVGTNLARHSRNRC